jgi:thiamine-phosphate pyrophosphorylase
MAKATNCVNFILSMDRKTGNFNQMELIVVTLPDYFEGEAELINDFFADGLRLLHIRKPVHDIRQFRELMKGIHPEYYPLISIHQHHEHAGEFSVQRLHFKEHERKSRSADDLKQLLSAGFLLSSSVHDPAELSALSGFDYVFLGPVFNSISKIDYKSVLADDFVLPELKLRVMAIGGVEATRLQRIQQMNFDGAAVLGTLWQHPKSPLAAWKDLLAARQNLPVAMSDIKPGRIVGTTNAPLKILNTNTSNL